MPKDELNLLLIQIREDEMKDHEYKCFIDKADLKEHQLSSLDVFQHELNAQLLKDVDAVMIGGSGAYCVSQKDLPMQDRLLQFTKDAASAGLPVFGACYGSHVLTEALGGTVIQDKDRAETGTYEVTRKEASADCPLFAPMPEVFQAQFGHKDHIDLLPQGAVSLARTDRSEHQAWTLPGQQVYAIQFHPELDDQGVLDRLNYYADMYVSERAAFDRIRDALKQSPHAPKVLERFLDDVVLGGKVYPKQD